MLRICGMHGGASPFVLARRFFLARLSRDLCMQASMPGMWCASNGAISQHSCVSASLVCRGASLDAYGGCGERRPVYLTVLATSRQPGACAFQKELLMLHAQVARLVCRGWAAATGRLMSRLQPERLQGGRLAARFPHLRALCLSHCGHRVVSMNRCAYEPCAGMHTSWACGSAGGKPCVAYSVW